MTKEEKLILLRHLLSDFARYNWSDGNTLDHYHKAFHKYILIYRQTEKEKKTCQAM